jgi:hypothetical protein
MPPKPPHAQTRTSDRPEEKKELAGWLKKRAQAAEGSEPAP